MRVDDRKMVESLGIFVESNSSPFGVLYQYPGENARPFRKEVAYFPW